MVKQPQSIDDTLEELEKYRQIVNKSIHACTEKDYSTALKSAEQALEINGERYEGYFAKGRALLFLDRSSEAEDFFTLGITLMESLQKKSKSLAIPYYFRGISRLRQNKNYLAEQDFTKSIDLNNDFKEAYLARSKVREALGNNEGAAKDREKTERFDPRTNKALRQYQDPY